MRVWGFVYTLVASSPSGVLRRYVGCVAVGRRGKLWGQALKRAVLAERIAEHLRGGWRGAAWLVGCTLVGSVDEVDAVPVESAREAYRLELARALEDRGLHPEDSRGGPFSSVSPTPQEETELRELNAWTARDLREKPPRSFGPLCRRHLKGACFLCGTVGHLARACPTGWAPEADVEEPAAPPARRRLQEPVQGPAKVLRTGSGRLSRRDVAGHTPADAPRFDFGVHWVEPRLRADGVTLKQRGGYRWREPSPGGLVTIDGAPPPSPGPWTVSHASSDPIVFEELGSYVSGWREAQLAAGRLASELARVAGAQATRSYAWAR
jgi:hypothetical protein